MKIKLQIIDGVKLLKNNKIKEAEVVFNKLKKINRNNYEILNALGFIESKQNNWQKAVENYEEAYKIENTDLNLYNNLSIAYKNIGLYEKSLEIIEQGIKLNNDYWLFHYHKGNILYKLLEKDKAITSYQTAFNLNPQSKEIIFAKIKILKEKKLFSEILNEYNKLINLNENDENLYYNRGLIYLEINEKDNAINDFNLSIEINPDNFDSYYNKSLILINTDPLSAYDNVKKSIELNENYCEAHNLMGLLLLKLGKTNDALKCFNTALSINKEYSIAYNNRGIVYADLLKIEEAEAEYKKAIEMDEFYPEPYNNLGILFHKRGDFKEAKIQFLKALELNENYVDAYCNLGNTLNAIGQIKQALDAYNKYIELKPDDLGIKHIINSLSGVNSDIENYQYVSNLFDNYANKFESSLINELEYKVPSIILEEINNLCNTEKLKRKFDILDLGCGTGLMGEKLIEISNDLIGIDLSKNMLKKANEKKIYTELIQSDIVSGLNNLKDKSFDFVIAADVFEYFGNLNEVLLKSSEVLKTNGYLIFTVEALIEESNSLSYNLNTTGRYAHSLNYLNTFHKNYAYENVILKNVTLRSEKGLEVMGYIVVLRKI
jgi:predicted TPR repeat methyltransferase/predicted negative regulator of RcsB-dependent stress response